MKITTVSANIRYSRDIGQGAWKVIELGAEASVDTREEWTEAQASLYQQLGQQLKALWNQGNGHKAQESTTEPPAQTEPPLIPAHYCQEHGTEHKRYERDGRVWYSHRLPNGKWCREK